ncbi:hypothetical protein SPMU_12260 [Sphingomonas mucosissima]|uniref:Uncharacterized protein n=1 Tax=Sphingomonas mucosissima TaxID=370959 RepID=A0A245ZT07_9SPHN|nr:hypothetical protein SPMU_12260 [Sphingomonas mucosissima]
MVRSLTHFVPSAVEEMIGGASLAGHSLTFFGANEVVPAPRHPALSYMPVLCQRPAMMPISPMLRQVRQRLNFLNIREVA